MTKVDQFESVFKSADKPVFHLEPFKPQNILLITDLDESETQKFESMVRGFFEAATEDKEVTWSHVADFDNLQQLLDQVEKAGPDLICTYRNLHSQAWKWPFSLGEALDVLTQVVTSPVLVLPHPRSGDQLWHGGRSQSVMAITDHLAGDERLVNAALTFTSKEEGKLYLTHIEDKKTFERYIELISKIPAIDTEEAREELQRQILKEPRDYIKSIKLKLENSGASADIESIVTVGRRIDDYRGLIEKHKIDLLVLNTKDDDQLAMHGLAYPLAVELRHVPMLML